MIDVHCHLEHEEYDDDREKFIEDLERKLVAVITCATEPSTLDKALAMKRAHDGFVFLTAGVHPLYVERVTDEERDVMMDRIREHADEIVSVGEAGLDYEAGEREKQKQRFREDLEFARELGKPVTIHSRKSFDDTAEILEEVGYHNVHWHLFKNRSLVENVLEHGWMVSIGPLVHSSRTLEKIVGDIPLEQIMLETDSPWWGSGSRGTPYNIRGVAEKIAEIKDMDKEDVWQGAANNAVKFFGLEY